MKRILIQVPEEADEWLREEAHRRNVSKSRICRMLIASAMSKKEQQ